MGPVSEDHVLAARVYIDNLREVLVAGASFSLVFTGFFIVSSYQTSVNAGLGAISLAVIISSQYQ